MNLNEGLLLVDKPRGKTSFSLVAALRRLTHIQKIGHAGTLDPFATGVMIMLIGKGYTKLSDSFLNQDKEYRARLVLGAATDSYDCEGKITATSTLVPSLEDIQTALISFQGTIAQVPPMFSAKKQGGKKLYLLARQGIEVARPPVSVTVSTQLIDYQYPYLDLLIQCSKGTYIRSIAHDLGCKLGCGAHLQELSRTRCGSFSLEECVKGELLWKEDFSIANHLRK